MRAAVQNEAAQMLESLRTGTLVHQSPQELNLADLHKKIEKADEQSIIAIEEQQPEKKPQVLQHKLAFLPRIHPYEEKKMPKDMRNIDIMNKIRTLK